LLPNHLKQTLVNTVNLCHAASKVNGGGDESKRIMEEADEVRRFACVQSESWEIFQHLLECHTSVQIRKL
jgi:hypothetical protein